MIVQKIQSPKSKAAVVVMRLDTMSVSRIRHCGRTRRDCVSVWRYHDHKKKTRKKKRKKNKNGC